jgi:hypothetical protein
MNEDYLGDVDEITLGQKYVIAALILTFLIFIAVVADSQKLFGLLWVGSLIAGIYGYCKVTDALGMTRRLMEYGFLIIPFANLILLFYAYFKSSKALYLQRRLNAEAEQAE